MLSVELCAPMAVPWIEMDSLALGTRAHPHQSADLHVLITDGDQVVLRADIYRSKPECLAFRDAILWGDCVFVGYGESVYVIHPAQRTGRQIPLSAYFAAFYSSPDYLLVASGESLLRLAPDGSVLWTADGLGLDGVVVNSVENGIIRGHGEWDPPGGWRPFTLRLDTGRLIPGH